ncbi:MAG: peptidoglycan-binding protein [Myxococcaceae bacterium]|nr:peptidoglycan-binding protein [Myxococcaceae bacterium]
MQVDVRTRDMISRAEAKLKAMGTPMQLQFSQGSFSSSVAASGSTHDGGGALDIRTRGQSSATVDKMVKALRSVGFAAWSRGRGHDNFAPHIHAIAIGDRRMSSGARWQVGEYFRGHSGLTAQGADADRSLGHPYPAWAAKYR